MDGINRNGMTAPYTRSMMTLDDQKALLYLTLRGGIKSDSESAQRTEVENQATASGVRSTLNVSA